MQRKSGERKVRMSLMSNINSQLISILKKKAKNISKESNKQKLAAILKDQTVRVARDGVKPSDGKPFSALKRVTIKRRVGLSKHNSTHGKYASAKSNATFRGLLLDSFQVFYQKHKYGFRIGYIISDAKHPGYNSGKAVIANKRSFSSIRRRLRRLGKDPAGIKQSNSFPLYRLVKSAIRNEIRKNLG